MKKLNVVSESLNSPYFFFVLVDNKKKLRIPNNLFTIDKKIGSKIKIRFVQFFCSEFIFKSLPTDDKLLKFNLIYFQSRVMFEK